jgi:uncharacterized repeat protein (TIGR01451 family)
MRVKNLLTAVILGLGLTLAVVAGLELGTAPVEPARAQGSIYYVDDNTCPATGSGTELDPFCRIQDAVDAAGDDDEVLVATGTYTGTQLVLDSRTGYTYTQVVFITKSLMLRGGYDAGYWNADPDPAANPTVIDAGRSGRGVSIVGASGDEPMVTIDGFTITGGDYTGLGNPTGIYNHVCFDEGQDCGGGIFAYRSSLTLRNSTVTDNIASYDAGKGGGIYLWHIAAPGIQIANTTIISNSTQGGGGGLYHSSAAAGPITITQSTFRENSATSYGGMYLYHASLSISETDFVSNTAWTDESGGLYLNGVKDLVMDRVRFQDNQAHHNIAALYLYGSGNEVGDIRLTNVLFGGNRLISTDPNGAVVYVSSYADAMHVSLAHVTAADNQVPTFFHGHGWGANHWLTATLTNTLLVSFTHGFAAYEGNDGETVIQHTHTLTDAVTTLHHTVAGTPTFQALNGLSGASMLDAYGRLLPNSAAIDAGIEAGVDHDLDGDPRPQGFAPDIGADEYVWSSESALTIAKTGPGSVPIGQPITYTLVVFNSGTVPITDVVVTDTIPVGAYFVEALDGGVRVGDIVSWTVLNLAPSSAAAHFVVTATETITNADYRVSASGGYSDTGDVPVITVIQLAGTRHVAPGGADGANHCLLKSAPCATIQHAVDVANPGEEVRVAAGTYTGVQQVLDSRTGYTYTQVVFITKTLMLRGGYDAGDWNADPDPAAHPTVIDAERQGRCVSIVGVDDDWPAVTVDGFTITGGDYTGLHNPSESKDYGGGIYAYYSGLTLRNSVVSDNIAGRDPDSEGGGIYIGEAHTDTGTRIEHTLVISNSASGSSGTGGGMRLLGGSSPITIAQSTFQDNVAGGSIGGLGMTDFYNPLTIVETDFLSNTAQSGNSGGAYIILRAFGKMRMDRVRFQDNWAHSGNAAFYLGVWAPGTAVPPARLTNILFGGNRLASTNDSDAVLSIYSSGVANNADISLAHVTAADNQVPTFLYASTSGTDHAMKVTLTNTLLVSFTNGFVASQGGSGETTIIHTNTLTDGVTTLHHTVGGTPTLQAINPLAGESHLDADYRLLPGSDAIDTGVEAGVDHDLDGQPRPEGAAPDIGADEFVPVKPVGVSVSGPTEGVVGESYTFIATPIPITATQPISYTWSPTPTIGQGTDTATYSWTTPGTKTLAVLLENTIGTVLVPGVHTITIRDYNIYLPLVIRNS